MNDKLLKALVEAVDFTLMTVPGNARYLRQNLQKEYAAYKEDLAARKEELTEYDIEEVARLKQNTETVEQYVDRQKEPIKVNCGQGVVIFNEAALKFGFGNMV